ncbi:hypothetical protein WN943_023601 [Citrus x changshan-huyou]
MIPRCMGNIFWFARAEWSLAENDAIKVASLVREVIKAKRMGGEVMHSNEHLGIEAWVVMFKEDMDKFEQEPSIKAYASSNPSIFIGK